MTFKCFMNFFAMPSSHCSEIAVFEDIVPLLPKVRTHSERTYAVDHADW